MTHPGFREAQRRIAAVGMANLLDLSGLDLNDKDLLALQMTLGALTALTRLDLDNNQLSTLPDTLGNLTALTRLSLYNNQLSTLPDTLGNLTALTELYLDNNQLSTVPKWLGRLTALGILTTAGNPLPSEVQAAAAAGMGELLRFLRLIDAEGVELAEAKLVLVGEPAVGKSSLLAALRGEPWVEDRDQTHGLQIRQVEVEHAGRALTLNGWDFGGQQVYRPTHQLFFTAPAVYLVVWKPREGPELGMVEQWLAMIQHRAGDDARVHVVATHGGPSSRVSSIDETRLRERFGPLVVGFHTVDSKVPQTLVGLRTAIAETAAGMPHSRRWYPASWLRVREELAGAGEQSLSYEGYLQVTARNGLTATGARSLAINSHALGHWIHYADEPVLAEVVILKPDWLSVAIAAVLEDEQAGQAGGLVPHRLFGQIWSRPTEDGDRRYTHAQQQLFLRMMERFELTYRVPELGTGEPWSLVGQLVPSGRPDLSTVWEAFRSGGPEAVEICQIVEKGTDRLVAPEGLIYRLIVRLHHQAMDRTRAPDGAHWRGGLVLQSRYGARALVTLTPDGVRVQVRGPDPSSYLHQVADEIRSCVEGFWEGLMTRALLPCQDPCGLGTPGRGLFDRDKLIEARERRRVDFPCGASGCPQYPTIDTLLGAGAVPGTETEQWGLLAQGVADIQARLDELAAGQAEGTERILTRLDTVDDDLKAGLDRNDAALTRIMRSLDDEAADGPRLFSLVPIDRTMIRPGWTTLRMRLTLYCEHSRWPVHALDPDHPEAGVYTLDVPRDWWVKAVPLIKGVATLIKPFLGISLASIELDLTATQWTAVKEQLALGKETLTAAADFAGAADATGGWDGDHLDRGATTGGIMRADGGVLRTLHAMLKQQDLTFADLRRVVDTRGRYLWVHPRYRQIYQPPLPEIPT
jgi:C-terminal of Roc, COR, domain/Ras of Complex, Roc, domain of DAPkinase/Leucine rich repeat